MRWLVAVLLSGLALVPVARSFQYVYWPDSELPVFLASGDVRFRSNLDLDHLTSPIAYVVHPDGTGLRLATDTESAESKPTDQSGSRLVFVKDDLYLVTAAAHRSVLEHEVYPSAGAALSPDGRIAVFAVWTGWAYSDGATLYSVPTDGSAEPTRLTPDYCTLMLADHTNSPVPGKCIDGTDGPDRLVGTSVGDLFITGSGNDVIRAGGGENVIESQWGDDDIRSGPGPDFVWAGDGRDTIRTGAGSDRIDPGAGRDTVYAGAGDDYVYANDGTRDVIDCGPGDDSVRVDAIDVTHNCEHRHVMAPSPMPFLP